MPETQMETDELSEYQIMEQTAALFTMLPPLERRYVLEKLAQLDKAANGGSKRARREPETVYSGNGHKEPVAT